MVGGRRARRGHRGRNAGVEGEVLHADAVAEDRAVRERARGVDGDDADGVAAAAVLGGEGAGERAFAGAGAAGNADGVGLAGVRKEGAQVFAPLGGLVFNAADDARERAALTVEEALDEVVHVLTSGRVRRRT
jgi:hypothetical protein